MNTIEKDKIKAEIKAWAESKKPEKDKQTYVSPSSEIEKWAKSRQKQS